MRRPRQCQHIHVACSGFNQRACAGIDGRAGGEDIIDEQHRFSFDGLCMFGIGDKRAAHIIFALRARKAGCDRVRRVRTSPSGRQARPHSFASACASSAD